MWSVREEKMRGFNQRHLLFEVMAFSVQGSKAAKEGSTGFREFVHSAILNRPNLEQVMIIYWLEPSVLTEHSRAAYYGRYL